jgi:cell wall-associated NlpC family hydrolase
MVPGDVLLHEGRHTAIYIGNGQLVHASINEKGTIVGGIPGDQTGKEICIRSYYNHPWNSVLRYLEMTYEQAIDFHARNSGIDKAYWLKRRNIDPSFAELMIKTAHN